MARADIPYHIPKLGPVIIQNSFYACRGAAVFAKTRDRVLALQRRVQLQAGAGELLLQLVANFGDPRVGGVTGELLLDCEKQPAASGSIIADGVGAYWKYEKWLRRRESVVWSTLGATGAIYALRRTLWQPLPPDTLLIPGVTLTRTDSDGLPLVTVLAALFLFAGVGGPRQPAPAAPVVKAPRVTQPLHKIGVGENSRSPGARSRTAWA